MREEIGAWTSLWLSKSYDIAGNNHRSEQEWQVIISAGYYSRLLFLRGPFYHADIETSCPLGRSLRLFPRHSTLSHCIQWQSTGEQVIMILQNQLLRLPSLSCEKVSPCRKLSLRSFRFAPGPLTLYLPWINLPSTFIWDSHTVVRAVILQVL